ncbi:MAG: hypothetical protein ACJ0DF_08260 [Paracoccaceae bacterium]
MQKLPLGAATAEPSPTKDPKLRFCYVPLIIIAASFGTTTDPRPEVTANPVKLASCEVTPSAVPCAEVIACPVTDTSSFGATAVPKDEQL